MRRAPLLALVFALAHDVALAQETVTILHLNDFHSRLSPVGCAPETDAAGDCAGGAARLATAVAARRAAAGNAPVAFLNAGDAFQGSLFYTMHKGLAEAEVLQALGTDVMVLGNHEFDDGPEPLAAFIDAVAFPVIGGNVDVSDEPALAGRVPAHVVLEVGGAPLGIVGALTPDTAEIASPGPKVRFADPVESLRAQVADLTAQGVTRIIALTHVGIEDDLRIAAEVAGLDAVIGGHSHTLMGGDGQPTYPTLVTGPDGRDVPVAQAGAYGAHLGELRLTFDADGVVTAVDGAMIAVGPEFAPDAAMADRVAALAEPFEALVAEVVGEATAPIDGSRETCRAQECAMGVLVAEAMLARTRDLGVSIAIQNGGGLRASIDAGPITRGEVLTVLPFGNALATVTLTGADVLAALENGVSQAEEGGGRFPQVAAAPGSRIVSAEVAEGDGWVALDPQADYGVVTNDYMRRGGDGYAVFFEQGRDAYDFGPALDEVVIAHLQANAPYAPGLRGTISKVGE
jgi:5'-nucleotidase / UDP-sugar diphosphatase